MRVLVTAASRHGSTAGIAEAITRTLNERGIGADYRAVDQVASLTGYDAVVLGSAV
jgi:menaquinone-dependent protoporphyrinogen oxidase